MKPSIPNQNASEGGVHYRQRTRPVPKPRADAPPSDIEREPPFVDGNSQSSDLEQKFEGSSSDEAVASSSNRDEKPPISSAPPVSPRCDESISSKSHRDLREVPHEDVKPRNYTVGYGKPPVDSRFKKGQCGNPNGRPKGSKNADTLLREALDEKVEVRARGRLKKMTKLEIGLRKLAHHFAETGDPKLAERILKMLSDPPPKKARDVGRRDEPQSKAERVRDEAILKWLIEQNRRNKDDPDDDPDDEPEPVM